MAAPWQDHRMPPFIARRKKLRSLVKEAKADALLVTNFINVTYLTGFTGDDSYLLATLDGETLITDPRYTTQLEEECPGLKLEIREPGVTMLPGVTKVVERRARSSGWASRATRPTFRFSNRWPKRLPKSRSLPRRI